MTPTAQVLCDILNDPAIPSEAKPSFGWDDKNDPLVWFTLHPGQLDTECRFITGMSEERANAALFWSLSAWLWERGVTVVMRRAGKSSGTHVDAYSKRGAVVKCRWEPSPVEALAAVVKEIAAMK